jgi:aryl-alcohol dehydrogenase-like predicted oxidoreductase
VRYKVFGNTGLRVSEMALGTGTFGTKWGSGADKPQARELFDHFVEQGGTLLDCADGYQGGEAESYLGEFIRAERANLAVATKFTTALGARSLLQTGNSRKAMVHSLEQSLKRLGTEYVDIYWVHFPDHVTPVDEIMRGLDDIVRAGKAHYIGLSDFPAWRVARAATFAELRAMTPLAAVQIEYSLAERTAEREVIPMASAFGMAVAIWSPLGGGMLTGKYRRGETGRRESGFGAGGLRTLDAPTETRLFAALDATAQELGVSLAQVAIAWVRHRGDHYGASFFPIIGSRKLAQLKDNLAAINVTLSAEQLQRLDAASAVPLGFPHEFIQGDALLDAQSGGLWQKLDRLRRFVP